MWGGFLWRGGGAGMCVCLGDGSERMRECGREGGSRDGRVEMVVETMWQSGLMRVTRNHVLSGAQVRILASSFHPRLRARSA